MGRWFRSASTSACSSTACRYKSASRSALSRCLLRSGSGSLSEKANELGVAAASWAAAGAGGVVAPSLRSEAESSGVLALPNVKTARRWRGIVAFTHLAREGRMTVIIGRRELLAALGGAAAAWPWAARAQQTGKLPTIGFLGANASVWSPWTAAFVERMRKLGWIEGRTIAFEYSWVEGGPERSAQIAAEFVRLKVDVIVTGTSAVLAAKRETSTIPIVFTMSSDPVG